MDIVHGALRISATMADGAADVSVRLDGDCEHHDVGGGISTRAALVWSLGEEEVAEAMQCGLQVRARGREDGRRVVRVATVGASADLGLAEVESTEGPQAQSIVVGENGVRIGFTQVSQGARLVTVDGAIEADPPDDDGGGAEDSPASFTISRLDFARAVLREREVRLDGSGFVPSIAFGGSVAQADAPESFGAETIDPNEP